MKYLIDGKNALHLAMGLATASTLMVSRFDIHEDREATDLFDLRPGEKVTTVGLLETPRVVALMGPSTPPVPGVFQNTPVIYLGGSVVADSSRVLQIISEGGGTSALRPFLYFATG